MAVTARSMDSTALCTAGLAASAAHASATSDEDLMSALSVRLEEGALEEIARRHRGRAERMARVILASADQAEDAVQECFLRLVRSRASYRSGAAFAPWFYSMLRNVCRDELRRRGPCVAATPDKAPSPCTAREEDPARTALERDAARAACAAMARLPAEDRDILAMRVHGNLPFEEIAATTGITVDCARKRAQRALDRLRQELS